MFNLPEPGRYCETCKKRIPMKTKQFQKDPSFKGWQCPKCKEKKDD